MTNVSEFKQDAIAHHGIKGQKWGVRRFQNKDGSYTKAGKTRKSKMADMTPEDRKAYRDKAVKIGKAALGVAATAAIAYGATKYMKQQAGKASLDAYISGDRYKRDRQLLDDYSQLYANETNAQKKQQFYNNAEEVSKRIGADAMDAYKSGQTEYKKYWKDTAKAKIDAKTAENKQRRKESNDKAKELNGKLAKATNKTLRTMAKISAGAAVIAQLDESRKAIKKASGKNKALTIAKESEKIVRKTDDFAKGKSGGSNNNNNGNKNSNSTNASTFDDGSRSSRQLTKEEKRIVKERRKAGESPREILSDMGLLAHSSDKFYEDVLVHHGIKGQHWGRRRFQNADGSLTPEGERRYASVEKYKQAKKDYRSAKREATRAKTAYKATKKYGSALERDKAKADYQKAKGMAKDAKKSINETDIRTARRRKALAIGAAALGAAAVGTAVYVNREHSKIAKREGRNAYDSFRNSDTYKQIKDRAHVTAQKKIQESRELADSYGKLHAQSRKNLSTLGVGDKFFANKKKEHLQKINEYSARQRKVDQMLENKANRIRRNVEDEYNNRRFVDKAKDVYRDKRRKRKK